MCLSKDRQLNQYWKKVALTACFYVRAARMDYHAPSCPCQLSNLLLKKKKKERKKKKEKKKATFKVAVPLSLSRAPLPSFYCNLGEEVPKAAQEELDAQDFSRQLFSRLHVATARLCQGSGVLYLNSDIC